DEVRSRTVTKIEIAARDADRRRRVAEQRDEMRLDAPQRSRLHANGLRLVACKDLEHLTDETFGRPVGEADTATPAAYARHLGRASCVVRREHHAEGRQNR